MEVCPGCFNGIWQYFSIAAAVLCSVGAGEPYTFPTRKQLCGCPVSIKQLLTVVAVGAGGSRAAEGSSPTSPGCGRWAVPGRRGSERPSGSRTVEVLAGVQRAPACEQQRKIEFVVYTRV